MGNGSEDRPLSYGQMRSKLEPDDTDGKAAILTVATAERRNFAPQGQPAEYKIVLTFEEFPASSPNADDEKELVLNATSYKTISAKLGKDERTWVGQKCVVAPTTTRYEGKTYEKTHIASPERWDKLMAASVGKRK